MRMLQVSSAGVPTCGVQIHYTVTEEEAQFQTPQLGAQAKGTTEVKTLMTVQLQKERVA